MYYFFGKCYVAVFADLAFILPKKLRDFVKSNSTGDPIKEKDYIIRQEYFKSLYKFLGNDPSTIWEPCK